MSKKDVEFIQDCLVFGETYSTKREVVQKALEEAGVHFPELESIIAADHVHETYIRGYKAWREKVTAMQSQRDNDPVHEINEEDVATDEEIAKLESRIAEGYVMGIDFGYDVKCECGSDATGLPYHSDWCPKFTGDL